MTVVRIAQLFALVGLDLSARGFPAGPPLRDAGHVALLERFRRRLAPELTWRLEVPVVGYRDDAFSDLRAWDATVGRAGKLAGIEAETHVHDVQALERRLALKQRDGGISCVVLLLSDTRHHQELVRGAASSLRASFPTSARAALALLGRGDLPPGNTIVLL